MRCPECSHSQKAKDGKTCRHCGYEYVFGKSDTITDGKFRQLLRRASVGDTQHFTFEQLYTQYCQDRAAVEGDMSCGGMTLIALLGVTAFVGFVLASTERPAWLWLGAAASAGIYAVWRVAREPARPPSRETLREWLSRWAMARKPLDRLLQAPSLSEAPASYREPDLFDYGAERVVVVEHDLLVDLLVKNEFHIRERAIVVSERGYPRHLVPHVKRLLAGRPEVPVLLLHDATPRGEGMRQRVLQGSLVPPGARVLDAGLFSADVPRITALTKTRPDLSGNQVRADALPMPLLAGGLAGAFATGLLLSPEVASATATSSGVDASGVADFG